MPSIGDQIGFFTLIFTIVAALFTSFFHVPVLNVVSDPFSQDITLTKLFPFETSFIGKFGSNSSSDKVITIPIKIENIGLLSAHNIQGSVLIDHIDSEIKVGFDKNFPDNYETSILKDAIAKVAFKIDVLPPLTSINLDISVKNVTAKIHTATIDVFSDETVGLSQLENIYIFSIKILLTGGAIIGIIYAYRILFYNQIPFDFNHSDTISKFQTFRFKIKDLIALIKIKYIKRYNR